MTKVALLFGGCSPEHEVSIVSARFVSQQLILAGFDVIHVGVDRAGRWLEGEGAFDLLTGQESVEVRSVAAGDVKALGADVVFSVIHGVTGEDGCVQGLCEMAGLPFVGGGMLNQNLCWDKIATRTMLSRFGLPQPDFVWYHRATYSEPAAVKEIEARFEYPVYVKPSRTGSSIGVSRASDIASLVDALQLAFQFDYRIIVEQGLNAREIEVAGLGANDPILSVPAEIVSETGFYDFEEKYLKDTARFLVPASLPEKMLIQLYEHAKRAWTVLNCYGMARIDFLVTEESAFLNEINTCPGFTGISMYPRLLRESGIPSPDVMKRLVELALARREHHARTFAFRSDKDWYKGGTS